MLHLLSKLTKKKATIHTYNMFQTNLDIKNKRLIWNDLNPRVNVEFRTQILQLHGLITYVTSVITSSVPTDQHEAFFSNTY